MKNIKLFIVLFLVGLFLIAGCSKQRDVTGFTAEDEITVENTSSSIDSLVSLMAIDFNSNNNKLTWNDELNDAETAKNIRYHVYKEMPDINQYKRIKITKKNYYYPESISQADPREYIVLKGVDGEISIRNTDFIEVPETVDSTSNYTRDTDPTTQGSIDNDNEGGDYPIDDYLPPSES